MLVREVCMWISDRWNELPKPGRSPTEADLRAFLADKVARWWMPDRVFFAEGIPHTATGKILKTALREHYADVLMTSVAG